MKSTTKKSFLTVQSKSTFQDPMIIIPYWLDYMNVAGLGFIAFQTGIISGAPSKSYLWITELDYKKHPERYSNAPIVTDRDQFGKNPLESLVWEKENEIPATRKIVTAFVKYHPDDTPRYRETTRAGICHDLKECVPEALFNSADSFSLAASHISVSGTDAVVKEIVELLLSVIEKWRSEYDDQEPYIARIG